MDANELVARNVRRVRAERRLSLGELARRAGVSKQTLSKMEAGIGNPTVETLAALATALDVSLRSLLTEWGSPVFVQRAAGASWADEAGQATRTMDQVYGSGYVRTAIVRLDESVPQRSELAPQAGGTLHHVYVISGRVRLGPVDSTVDLDPGDFVRYPGDGVHVVERLGPQVVLHVVTTVPQVPQFGPERQADLSVPA